MSHSGSGGHSGHSGGHSSHAVHHDAGQSGHPSHHFGNLSNDNMLGGNFQYWNLANFMEGLRINTGIRFAILFIAFAGWLYVIYWVRHHEPFVNQMIGTHSYLAPTAPQDKSIVAAIKKVFPLKTSENMGTLYVPSPEAIEKPKEFITTDPITASEIPQHNDRMIVGPGQAISAPVEYSRSNFDERFGLPANSQTNYNQVSELKMEPLSSGYENNSYPIKLNTNLPAANSIYANYQIQTINQDNHLLGTVVNR